ncbi:MAG TPA: NAD(P)-dependent oxidoreductase [Solirubrobacteraceae bacterium]|nr:NAD(P)-dependent oxidoreductase [Solirubrobacteraceae bacterium]
MTIVVTGATGFLGAAMLPLLAERDEVVALHRPGATPAPAQRVRWVAQDLAGELSAELPDRVDSVLHIAQSRRYREFPAGAVDVVAVNTMATARLLDYCHRAGGRTFVFASTGAVSGAGPEPIDEDAPPRPSNLYAVSKHAGEQLVEQYRSVLLAHSLRYFFIYGPGQRGMMMPGIIERVAGGQEVQLAGDNGISLNPVYVEDAVRATVAALDLTESATVNVAGPQVVTIREIAQLIADELGTEPAFVNLAPQPDFVASTERMARLLGAPTTSPREGLARTIAAR